MLRLFVKDSEDGSVHEYGTNPHDSLILNEDGSIHYLNAQNCTGTRYPEEGYRFCLEDGSIPDDTVEPYEAILDIGGEYHSQLNFYNCLRLIHECVKAGVIQQDPENQNNILVYRNVGEYMPEGWYAENAHDAARELMSDTQGQKDLQEALSGKSIKFKPESLIFFF